MTVNRISKLFVLVATVLGLGGCDELDDVLDPPGDPEETTADVTASHIPPPVKLTDDDVTIRYSPYRDWSSSPRQYASAGCEPGETVLGGGAKTIPGDGEIQLQAMVPGSTYYWASAVAKYDYSERWTLQAYAICAPVRASVGVEVVSRTSDYREKQLYNGGYGNDVAAPCPAGKRIVGTGGAIRGPASFQQIRPNQHGAYAFVQGVNDRNDWGSPVQVTAYAVCAYPIQGWHVVIGGTDWNDERYQQTHASCPGQQVIGGGLTKGDWEGEAHFNGMYPSSWYGQHPIWVVLGAIPSHRPTHDWNLAAWAVCVDK